MTNILELPLAILVDVLLPLLSNRDLATLRLVSRFAKRLAEDEVVWKRKTVRGFSFPSHATARMGGWFNLYRGLSNPQVYVWGEVSHGRSGIALDAVESEVREDITRAGRGIPYPIQQPQGAIEGTVVEVVAGGWSFHARTSDGSVWRWGAMDGETYAGPQASENDPAFICPLPRRLDIPKVKALSGGRCHAIALTESGELMEWRAWGSVYHHNTVPPEVLRSGVTQLEAGWLFSALLTGEGEIFIWYSDWSRDAFYLRYFTSGALFPVQTVLPINVRMLPLPPFPEVETKVKMKQIAAGEDFIIALTDDGRLYRLDLHLPREYAEYFPSRPDELAYDSNGDVGATTVSAIHILRLRRFLAHRSSAAWQPLPLFSAPDTLPTFSASWLRGGALSPRGIASVSAHFRHFVAYLPIDPAEGEEGGRETLVLLGTPGSTEPEMIPELQASGVIKVSMGDYHFGALTAKGEVWTWGSFAKGALGNWTTPWEQVEVEEEREQREEGERRGWFSTLLSLPRPAINSDRRRARVRVRGSTEDVRRPTKISIVPHPSTQTTLGGGGVYAYDLAFAGWQSLALVMQLPSSSSHSHYPS